jgi:hypothetical protein
MYTGNVCKRVFSFDHWAKDLPPKTSFGHSGGGDAEEGGVSSSGGWQVQVLGTLASSKRPVVPPPLFAHPSCLASPFAAVAGVAGVGPWGSLPAAPAREVDGHADDRLTADGQKQEEGGMSRSQTQEEGGVSRTQTPEEAPFAARYATPAQEEGDFLSLGGQERQPRENGRIVDGKLRPHYFVGEHLCMYMYGCMDGCMDGCTSAYVRMSV